MQPPSERPLILESSAGARFLTRGSVVLVIALLAAHLAIGPLVTPSAKEAVLFELVGIVFWGAMLVVMLVEFRRVSTHRLEIAVDAITVFAASGTKRVRFQDVTSLNWRPNTIRLHGKGTNMGLNLGQYEPLARFDLLRRLRNGVPIDRQSGWEGFFCWSVLPLLRCKSVPGPGEFVTTRRRWDVIFAIAMIPALAVAWFTWHVTRQPRMLLIPLFLLPVWLPVRWSTPRRGMVVRSATDKASHDLPFLLGMASVFPLTFAGIIVHKLYGETVPGVNTGILIGALLLLAAMFAMANRQDRRMKAQRQHEQAKLVAQYDWITGWPHDIDFERRPGDRECS
jgi:hypothetical protein